MQVLTFLLAWMSRIAISRLFSSSYLGISGLFNDILSVLQLSELGIGTAMLAALYRPAAEKDEDRVQRILNYYRRLYIAVATLIAIAGLMIMPFLPVLVKGLDGVGHPYIYYLLFLLDTVLSYFCTWKNSLFYVYQKQYVLSFWNGFFQLARYAAQLAILLLTRNFILFVGVQAACAFLPNYVCSKKAERRYPDSVPKDKGKLPDKKERRSLLSGIGAMSMHKIGGVLVNNTDSLIMSAFLGLSQVGIYSNYRLVVNTLSGFMRRCTDAFTGGVGNLGATENGEKVYAVYREIHFLSVLGYGYCTSMMVLLFRDYILSGFGSGYLLGNMTVLLIAADFYTKGMRTPVLCFRDAEGLFRYDRYKPVFEIIINLVASILLVRRYDIAGIVMGTLISFFSTSFWIDPLVLMKEGIRKDWKKKYACYFADYIFDSAVMAGITAFLVWLLSGLPMNGIKALLIKGMLGTLMYFLIFILIYLRKPEMKALRRRAQKFWAADKKNRRKEVGYHPHG